MRSRVNEFVGFDGYLVLLTFAGPVAVGLLLRKVAGISFEWALLGGAMAFLAMLVVAAYLYGAREQRQIDLRRRAELDDDE